MIEYKAINFFVRNDMAVYRCRRCKTAVECGQDDEFCVCGTCGKKQRLPKSFKRLFDPDYDPEKAAKKRKTAVAIAALALTLCVAFVILLITVIIPSVKYNNAINLYNSGNYEKALAEFKSLKEYKDSTDRTVLCRAALKEQRYEEAVRLYETGAYEEALEIFSLFPGYKDSEAYIAACGPAIKDIIYNKAVAEMNGGDVIRIYETLIGLDGYKDSREKAKEIFGRYKDEKLKVADIGDTVYLGKYEQDNDPSNGKEDIEWLVIDKAADRVLVISKYALDSHPYHTSKDVVTWNTCALRAWLNGTFYNEAFDFDEQERVIPAAVTADENPAYATDPGSDTTDRIFILSVSEANRYFSTYDDRMCEPTEYAIARGVGVGNSFEEFGKTLCWWVLRTPGFYPDYTSFVFYSGYVNVYGYDVSLPSDAIRPVMWISTK